MHASTAEAQRLFKELTQLWHGMAGQAPQTWEQDLSVLETWWQPWKHKAKLVSLIEALPSVDLDPQLPQEWFLRVGEGVVLTPEGRLAIDGLRKAIERRADYDWEAHPKSNGELVPELHRRLAQRNLRRIVENLIGEGEAMYLLPTAALLIIIASGADTQERALIVDSQRKDVNLALERSLTVLRDSLGQRSGKTPPFGDYPCTRAADRIGSALVLERPSRHVVHAWVDRDRQAEVIEKVAVDLARRRKPLVELKAAVVETLAAYERGHHILAAAAGATSTPKQRAELRQQVLLELDRAGATPSSAGVPGITARDLR